MISKRKLLCRYLALGRYSWSLEMVFDIKPESLVRICILFAGLPKFITGKSSFSWPWNIFRQTENNYDKNLEGKANLTTEEWIKQFNYPSETHNLTTEDGYSVILHRIPKPGYQPVLLVHGLLMSSLGFVMTGVDNGLAFQFATSDFDVWLADTRGTVVARNYSNMTDPLFWEFSYHEIGLYDASSMIDFVRNATSFHQLVYVGHSLGATALFVLCAIRPEYNDKILLMQALAPVVFLKNLTTWSLETTRAVKRLVKERNKSKSLEIFPQGYLPDACSLGSPQRSLCLQLMTDLFGQGLYNQSLDPIVLGSALAGGSIKSVEHFLQVLKSGDFAAYDYGLEGNRRVYHQVGPDAYDLSNITFPVILHYSHTDAIATGNAVHKLYKALSGVIGVYAVPSNKFNHLDFIMSTSSGKLINANVVKLCQSHMRGNLKYRID